MATALVHPDAYFGREDPSRHAARRSVGLSLALAVATAFVAHGLSPGAWGYGIVVFLGVVVLANVLHAMVWLAHGDGPGVVSLEIAAWATLPAVVDVLIELGYRVARAAAGAAIRPAAVSGGLPTDPFVLATSLLATAWIVVLIHAGVRHAHGVEDYRAMFIACVVGGIYGLVLVV